jgi:DNA-3-methyladenine glycosylase
VVSVAVETALGPRLGPDFFERPVAEVAPDLIGCVLLHDGVGGRIVEVERYQEDDPASHSFGGPRGRAVVMFGPPGRLYVYRSYGIHWCLNLVCEPAGRGAAVLIRAIEPQFGLERMRARRAGRPDRELAAGPGRVAQALAITGEHDGAELSREGPGVEVRAAAGRVRVARGPRIGITRAAARPWRYALAGSRHLSRPLEVSA